MTKLEDLTQSMEQACSTFALAARAAIPIFEQFNDALEHFGGLILKQLEAMGFEADECQEIIELAAIHLAQDH